MARRGDDKIARLADRHEITHHVRMRNRDRTAGLDLRLELRHHRSVRRQHVAEAHRDQAHRLSAAVACCINSRSSAWQYISAKRLVTPSIETGSIALSVEIITIADAPAATAASATLTEPKTLVLTPSPQSRSRIGTCLSAAA